MAPAVEIQQTYRKSEYKLLPLSCSIVLDKAELGPEPAESLPTLPGPKGTVPCRRPAFARNGR